MSKKQREVKAAQAEGLLAHLTTRRMELDNNLAKAEQTHKQVLMQLQQLTTQIEQVRGAIAAYDEMINKEKGVLEATQKEDNESKTGGPRPVVPGEGSNADSKVQRGGDSGIHSGHEENGSGADGESPPEGVMDDAVKASNGAGD